MLIIKYTDEEKNEDEISVDKYPDECPICRKGNEFKPLSVFYKSSLDFSSRLQVVSRCPRHNCQTMFFAFYTNQNDRIPDHLFFNKFGCIESTEQKNFPDPIPKISPRFLKIYFQADIINANGLDEVRGLAYGKALEVLIKDYLMALKIEDEDEIKNEFRLAKIIEKISDPDLQIVADRVSWIRNDEAHYLRKWKEQDVNDLKSLIELTVQHIRRVELTKEYREKMPNQSKKMA